MFLKASPTAPAGSYPAEAAALAWLAAAGPGSARVVSVLDVTPDSITLERLRPAAPTLAAAAAFGRALAVTHVAGAASFGQPPDGWTGDGFIGRQRLPLRPQTPWGAFYAEQRCLPYARRAYEVGHLSRSALDAVERVCTKLSDGNFDDDRPPARIHGDLWTGNLVFTATGAVLIDPAAHGGHGLTDLAMLDLLGAPHLTRVLDAYAEAARLAPGWRELVSLHQLHPLLVHAASHGPAYGRQAEAVALRYA